MTEAIVKYGQLSDEEFAETDAEVSAVTGGDFVDIEEGENVYRVVPPLPGVRVHKISAVHYIDAVPGLDKTIIFHCPRHVNKEPCVACERVRVLLSSASPHDREVAKKIKAKLQGYVNVIDRKETEPRVRTLRFGAQIWKELKKIFTSPKLGGNYTDPTENGFDLIIVREGTGQETKYSVSADRQNSPLTDDPNLLAELIEGQPDLNMFVDTTVPEDLISIWEAVTMRPSRTGGARPGAGLVANARRGAAVAATPQPARKPAPKTPARSAIEDADMEDDFEEVFDEDTLEMVKRPKKR